MPLPALQFDSRSSPVVFLRIQLPSLIVCCCSVPQLLFRKSPFSLTHFFSPYLPRPNPSACCCSGPLLASGIPNSLACFPFSPGHRACVFCVLPGLQPVTSLTSPRERARGLLAAWQYGSTRKARKLDVLIKQLAAQQKLPALMWSSPPRLPRLRTPRTVSARTATRKNSNTQTTIDNSP